MKCWERWFDFLKKNKKIWCKSGKILSRVNLDFVYNADIYPPNVYLKCILNYSKNKVKHVKDGSPPSTLSTFSNDFKTLHISTYYST